MGCSRSFVAFEKKWGDKYHKRYLNSHRKSKYCIERYQQYLAGVGSSDDDRVEEVSSRIFARKSFKIWFCKNIRFFILYFFLFVFRGLRQRQAATEIGEEELLLILLPLLAAAVLSLKRNQMTTMVQVQKQHPPYPIRWLSLLRQTNLQDVLPFIFTNEVYVLIVDCSVRWKGKLQMKTGGWSDS